MNNTEYLLKSYQFPLPEELIAQEPAQKRDASRLMVLEKGSGETRLGNFGDILEYLPEGCLLVANNSRVIPARMHGKRESGGKVEFLLLTPLPLIRPEAAGVEKSAPACALQPVPQGEAGVNEDWLEAEVEGLLKSSKQVRLGEIIRMGPDMSVELLERGEFGRCRVRLFWQGELMELLSRYGSLPLPPYIRRPAGEKDAERYQTTYSRPDKAGSVAAPTAGLHFTPELRKALAGSGREWAEVTLYVGYGTFSPVRCEDIREHPMHEEYVEIPHNTAQAIARAQKQGRPIIAVGTTSVRVLEGVWEALNKPEQTASRIEVLCARPVSPQEVGQVKSGVKENRREKNGQDGNIAYAGWVNCFLYPGKEFHVVNGLITNFHLPGSSLIMLVSALAGRKNILNAYARAVTERFRFFSYGDAMLIR